MTLKLTGEQQRELLATYPTIIHAVAWVELIADKPPEGETESTLDLMRQAFVPLSECILMLQECMEDEVREGSKGKHAEALVESGNPEFRKYLMAKLGMM